MNDKTVLMRRYFAGVTAGILLASFLWEIFDREINAPEAVVVLISQVPVFLPAAIYYFFVSKAPAALICGIVLAVFTIPPAILLVLLDEPPYFLAGWAFMITLVSSILGAFASRKPTTNSQSG